MKKSQVDHVLRAAREVAGGADKFIIVGSQSLHGKFQDIVDDILVSREVDLFVPSEERLTGLLNAIGEGSLFHETYGYYADPVSENTAVLPKGWKRRLVNLPLGDTDGAKGLCLDPHDLAVSKYIAGREKDRIFTSALVRKGLLDRDLLLERLAATKVDERIGAAARAAIDRDFNAPDAKPSNRRRGR
jgi:hypothetical protein